MKKLKTFPSMLVLSSILITFLAIAIFSFGCKKEQANDLQKNESSSCISANLLQFTNIGHFTTFMTNLHEIDEEDFASVTELQGFYSHKDFYRYLENEPEDSVCGIDEDAEIEDVYLSSVLNVEREVKIGDVIYQLGNDFCFAYLDCLGKDQIQNARTQILSGQFTVQPGELLGYSVKLWVFRTDEFNLEFGDSPVVDRASEVETNEFKDKRRIKGKMWQTNWFIYRSNGVKTKMQKKVCGIWVKTDASRVDVSWDVTFYNTFLYHPNSSEQCNSAIPVGAEYVNDVGSKTKNNDDKVEKVFDFSAGGGLTVSGGAITGGSISEGLMLSFVRHNNPFRNTLSNHSVLYDGSVHSTSVIRWNKCN
ncbi:MAG: hypothetical protein HY842_20230 [Bacteroidetes bacterium]|nr:hypothetical protein [Bacteroidota bacterium]